MPDEVQAILKTSCYDCHSNNTVYPWYNKIQPVAWWLKNHIDEGRKHLNFSTWGTYNKDLKENMLTKSVQTIQNKTMPMPGYIVYHKEANLSEAERALLIQYFEDRKSTRLNSSHQI